MNARVFFGCAFGMVALMLAPYMIARWVRRGWSAIVALRVLLCERRFGETLDETAMALASDAHEWRGLAIDPRTLATKVQPSPQNIHGPALWPLIISELDDSETDRLVAADMQARHEFGVAKYGVPLVVSNGHDHLADAYQEALDGVVYLRAAFDEQALATCQDYELSRSGCVGGLPNLGKSRIHQCYVDALDLAKELREVIAERDRR
jgi:hypothetical protein